MKYSKELVFKLSAAFILFVLFVMGMYAFITNSRDKNIIQNDVNIPVIKEHYTSSFLSKYVEFDNRIRNVNNRFLIKNNNEDYYLNYVNNQIQYEKVYNSNIKRNYTLSINEKNNKKYIIKDNNISDMYDNIIEVSFDNIEYSYLIVCNDNDFSIINLKNDEIINIDSDITNIIDIYDYNGNIISDKYIIIENNGKYGLVNYNGEVLIETRYDYLKIVNSNTFIAKRNNKYGVINLTEEELIKFNYQDIINYSDYFLAKKDNKYGVIDKSETLIHNFEMDYVEVLDNSVIVIKNNRLGLFKDRELVIDYQVPTKNNQISYYKHNDELLISSYIDNNVKTYIIRDYKLYKIIHTDIKEIYITDYIVDLDAHDSILDKYTYSTNIKNNRLTLYIYDDDYDKYYEHDIDLDFNINDYYISSSFTKNFSNDYYKLIISLDSKKNDSDSKKLTYYYDLNKRTVLKEKDALVKYLDNGYSFTINDNYVLKVYKNDELISEHFNIEYYIGGYYFANINGVVYKLEFKNES